MWAGSAIHVDGCENARSPNLGLSYRSRQADVDEDRRSERDCLAAATNDSEVDDCMTACFCCTLLVSSCVWCLQSAKHSPVLMKLICDELKVGLDDILDFELCLADAAPSVCQFYHHVL